MKSNVYNMLPALLSPDHGSAVSDFNLDLFFESSADLLCIAGYDGYFKRINPTVSKTLGYTNDELFSRPINTFVHHEDKDLTSRNREKLHKNTPLLNFENRYVTKSGEVVWLSWTSMPIDSEQMIFAIAKNITHKKKQEEDRNALIAALTKTNHDLKQLTYTTSHDLRSPVSNLLSVFGFMDVTRIKDSETRELVDMLREATESLKVTLNGYVDALNQKDVLHVALEELDLLDCLNSVVLSLKSLIVDSKARITADFSALASVKFNRGYLRSIFLNLITNSIKYARPGISPVINICSVPGSSVSHLIYSDEGQGFDMAKVKYKIFGLNQKFHNHDDSKGIGLYLVHNYITSLGGHISVESQPDNGARFTISLQN